jgi:hypothetical protein
MTERVKLLKRHMRGLPGPKLSIRQATGSMNWRVYVETVEPHYAPFSLEQRQKLEELEVLSPTHHPRTNQTSVLDIELDILLGLREKKPICTSCGSTWKTEEDARQCGLSH